MSPNRTVGAGNISVHSQQEQRYRCDVCQSTFAASKGTIFYRLKTDAQLVMIVLTLLAHGCPRQAIVAGQAALVTPDPSHGGWLN